MPYSRKTKCLYNFRLWYLFADILQCTSHPCMNGATCLANPNSYLCSCVAGYTGTHCETGSSLIMTSTVHHTRLYLNNNMIYNAHSVNYLKQD